MKVTPVAFAGVNVTPLLNAVVPLMVTVSAAAFPKVTSPFPVKVEVKVPVPVTDRLLLTVEVPELAPSETVVAAPPIFKDVALVLKTEAEAAVVVKFPPLAAMSPAVVIRPEDPVIEKLVAEMSLAPKERALAISGSERSMALVIPPAADWTLIPAAMLRLVS